MYLYTLTGHFISDFLVKVGTPFCLQNCLNLRKSPPHHYTTSSSLTRWYKAEWIHAFMLFTFWPYHLNVAAEIETHQTRRCFSNFGHLTFLVERSGALNVACCCSYVFFKYQRFGRSEMVFCLPWLKWVVVTVAFLSSQTSLPVHLWLLTSTLHLVHPTATHWIFSRFWTILWKLYSRLLPCDWLITYLY